MGKSDYKIISEFMNNGIKMVTVRINPTGCVCTMEESDFDRMILKELAYGKQNKKEKSA